MPKPDKEQKLRLLEFAGLFLAAWVVSLIPASLSPLSHASTFLYCILLVSWIVTVQERVLHPSVRRLLILGAVFLIGLFLLRFCRWDAFASLAGADRFLWYAYYVPFTVVPMISLHAAICLDNSALPARPARFVLLLWCIAVLLCALVISNEHHNLVFRIEEHGATEYSYRYTPLYYGIFAWCMLLALASSYNKFVAKRNQVTNFSF